MFPMSSVAPVGIFVQCLAIDAAIGSDVLHMDSGPGLRVVTPEKKLR